MKFSNETFYISKKAHSCDRMWGGRAINVTSTRNPRTTDLLMQICLVKLKHLKSQSRTRWSIIANTLGKNRMSMTSSECNEVLATIQHVTEGCPLPTKSLPPTKHNLNDSDLPYYKYIPADVLESVNYILY
jgi:hypothetical protein